MRYHINKGWERIISESVLKIESLGAKIIYVNEKYGLLVIDVDNLTDEVLSLLNEIEEESGHICKECSKVGEIRDVGGWMSVLCEDCYTKELEERHKAIDILKKIVDKL